MPLEPGEVPCRWASGALRCPAPAALTRGVEYAEKRFCVHHQGVTKKVQGDFIMHELLAGRVPPRRELPIELRRLKASLHGEGEVDGGGPLMAESVTADVPVLYTEDEPLFAEAVAIGRKRYTVVRRAGVPGEVAIDQAFFVVANWDR